MKTIMLFLLTSFIGYTQPKPITKPDFRSVYWGDSVEKVLKMESIKPDSVAVDFIQYDTIQLGEHKAKLTYVFDNEGLIYSSYLIYLNGLDRIDRSFVYMEKQKALSVKYGAKRTNYTEKSITQAVYTSEEHTLSTYWSTPKTKVELIMNNEAKVQDKDFLAFIGILYTGVAAERKRDSLQKKQDADKRKQLLKDL